MTPALRRWLAGLTLSVVSAGCAAGAAPQGPRIAVTFDDLPAHGPLPPGETRLSVGRSITATLKAAGLPPTYGFVNGVQTEREPGSAAVLKAWRDAGFPLGNHTWSHRRLESSDLAAWEADVLQDESLLEARMGGAGWRWLRFPYLEEGEGRTRADARAFLARHGYRIAQVTMSFDDYAFNAPYARCAAAGDRAGVARLETGYLAAAAGELDHARWRSQAALGRQIPFVLLMHLGAFDARMLPRLLDLYSTRHVRFVTLGQAQADPFYRSSLDLASTAPDTLEGALAAKGAPAAHGADLAWLDALCR